LDLHGDQGLRERVAPQVEVVALVVVGNERGVHRQVPERPDRQRERDAIGHSVDVEAAMGVGPHRVTPARQDLGVHQEEVPLRVAHAATEVEGCGLDDDCVERERRRVERQIHRRVPIHEDGQAPRGVPERLDPKRMVARRDAPEAETAVVVRQRGAVSLERHDRVRHGDVGVGVVGAAEEGGAGLGGGRGRNRDEECEECEECGYSHGERASWARVRAPTRTSHGSWRRSPALAVALPGEAG